MARIVRYKKRSSDQKVAGSSPAGRATAQVFYYQMLTLIFLTLCANLAGAQTPGHDDLALIPQPAHVQTLPGRFVFSEKTAWQAASAFTNEAALLRRRLLAATGLPLPVLPELAESSRSAISLLKAPPGNGGPEAYSLEVTPARVTLRAAQPAGMFRATQTLLQLLPAEVLQPASPGGARWELPCVRIDDAPRFEWRGLMLDCSRTFQSVEYLRQTLDRMALCKLNVLHLHLTDDQGWRLEIKKYPNLARQAGFFPAQYDEPAAHQGYYTQQQMRELVAYAAARHILIVPEIEMPGHSLALLSVMPQLACTGGPFEFFPYSKGPGITEDVLCAGKEETFAFLRDVLEEVTAIFPSPFVHIGGDEVPKTRWQHCPLCQQRMKQEGLKTEAELQGWFNRRIERMLAAQGRRLIGWDEILEGGVSPATAVMGWRGVSRGLAAAQSGHDVVMTPNSHCYFDYTYAASDSARVFSYDPVAGLPTEAARRVLGVQASFWSHIDRAPELVDRQLFPRLLALAERGWSPDNRGNWPDYQRRARANLGRLEKLGIHYEPLDLLGPAGAWTPDRLLGGATNLEFDVTASITGSGQYQATAIYGQGRQPLRLRAVELLRGTEVVARDEHESLVGSQSPSQVYSLRMPPLPEAGHYRLRVTLDPAGGTNSSGKIYVVAPTAK
jgi:hexosaminidase